MKRGQMQISFGMIFSIILIVAFLGFAFYAIKIFLGFQNDAKAGKFLDDIQSDIDRIWRSSQSSEPQEYVVPSYADFVCFIDFSSDERGENDAFYLELKRADYGNENLAFYPVKFTGFESKEINHIDIGETTAEENPLCIKTSNGRVSLTLKKDFGEALVTITKG
ncbi:MAG: hypothetical protein Q8P79_03720 [Nanoarchaeota archaeon]|nr:hypothetical protein [Nanoarchaeota archaeon]